MRILKRQVLASKSGEQVTSILKSSAYYYPKAKIENSEFSIHCAKRHNGRYLSLIHVTGNASEDKTGTVVMLEIHANLYYFLGLVVAFAGALGLLYCLMWRVDRWIPCLGMILLGLLVSGQQLWEGSELLDLLEHKLTR